MRDILKFILDKVSSNVSISANITEAYQYFMNNQIDVVIFDVKMPRGDGFKLLKMIRDQNTRARPRFIFISDEVELTKEQELIVQKQTDGFLSKPLQQKVIIERIRELLKLNF